MKFLANHVEKLVFAAIVLVCLFSIISESGMHPEEKDIRDSLETKRNAIESALRDNVPPLRKDPNYEEIVSRTLAGPAAVEIQAFAPRSAYPLLPRPKFPEKVVEVAQPEAEAIAVLRAPINVEAAADRGRVYVSWEPSPENQLVATVRAILDVSADGGATWKEAAVEEFSPEDAAVAEKKDEKAQKTPAQPQEEDRRRQRRGERVDGDAEAPRGEKAKPGAGKKLTEQEKFKNKYVFLYQEVEPKKTYHFRVRHVCRLASPPKGEKLREPEGCRKFKSKSGKTDLFESQPSAAVSAATPPDVEIRFAGSIGEKGQEGYMANFEVRKWDPKIRNWRKGMARIGIGEEIAVIVRYRNEDTKSTEAVELKSGYRLTDVESVEVSVVKEVDEILTEEVPVKDEDGNPVIDEKTKKPVTERRPVMDPKTGQPVKVKREKETKIPSQFAVLTEIATGKVEKIEKREDFEARQQYLQYLEQVLKEREEEKSKKAQ